MNFPTTDIFTVTIEPVRGCNLACKYCYADTHNKITMDIPVFRIGIKKCIAYAEALNFQELHIIWHGSEPLLAGIDFLSSAFEIVKSISTSCTIRQFIQTNGLLLTNDFCALLKNHQINVGISLDGPEDIHDCLRNDLKGNGTFQAIMESMQLLQTSGVMYGICAVASRLHLGREQELIDFYNSLQRSVRFNPIIPSSYNKIDSYLFFKTGEYGQFLSKIFDLYTSLPEVNFRISPIDNYIRLLDKGKIFECIHQPTCIGTSIGIKPDGQATVCGRFNDIFFGNILNLSIEQLMKNNLALRLRNRDEALIKCNHCKFRNICNLGCPHNAFSFHGSFETKDPFCHDYQIIFSNIQKAIKCFRGPQIKDHM